MRAVVRISAALVGIAAASSAPDQYELAFRDFVTKYDRAYASPEEEAARLAIFTKNLKHIKAVNAKDLPYKLGVNEFADQAPEEFQALRLGLSRPSTEKMWKGLPYLGSDPYSGAALPDFVDWSTKGAVTPPNNQGQCGSCWAFSTTGAVEGAWAVATGKLVSLSEQQLVDCSTENMGCNGGDMYAAFQFLQKHDVCTEESYPYTGRDGTCHSTRCTAGVPQGGIAGFKDVPSDDEQALMEAVTQQPVAIAIEADQMAFQLYSGGILTKECGTKLYHGVLAVGYGTESGVPYWKVKNSWGASWGEEGYIRIERGVPKDGECGINAQPSYPVADGSVLSPSPAPGPAPGPAPSPPAPGCTDDEDFCTDPVVFSPQTDCDLLASFCKETCDCCGASPRPSCSEEASVEAFAAKEAKSASGVAIVV